jgi:uncharacterized membrane protein required for colicin V production
MNNWITTVCGAIAGLPVLLNLVGLHIPDSVAQMITAIATSLLGAFAADSRRVG